MKTKNALFIFLLSLFLSPFTFNPNTFLNAAGPARLSLVLDRDGDPLLASVNYYIVPTSGGGLSIDKDGSPFILQVKNKGYPVRFFHAGYTGKYKTMVLENIRMTVYHITGSPEVWHKWMVSNSTQDVTIGVGTRNLFKIVKVRNILRRRIYKLQACSWKGCFDIGIRTNRVGQLRLTKNFTKTFKFEFKKFKFS